MREARHEWQRRKPSESACGQRSSTWSGGSGRPEAPRAPTEGGHILFSSGCWLVQVKACRAITKECILLCVRSTLI